MNSLTGIFQGFYLDFKNMFLPEQLWVAAANKIFTLFFSKVLGLKPEIKKWAHSHILLIICWGYFPWRHTMSFQRLFDVCMTSAYRRRIDVEMMLCVYRVTNLRMPIYQNTSQCLLRYVHSLYLRSFCHFVKKTYTIFYLCILNVYLQLPKHFFIFFINVDLYFIFVAWITSPYSISSWRTKGVGIVGMWQGVCWVPHSLDNLERHDSSEYYEQVEN